MNPVFEDDTPVTYIFLEMGAQELVKRSQRLDAVTMAGLGVI